jgi:arylsulfatase
MDHERRRIEHLFARVPAPRHFERFLATYRDLPPSRKPGSFSIDRALEALLRGTGGS